MSRRALALLVFFLALLVSSPSLAQYMYLDANGDGVHTDADVVPAAGDGALDVWLVTNQGRDGRPAVCNTGDGQLTMNSYVVNLRASGGTVVWAAFTNQVPDFYDFPLRSDSLEFCGGAYKMAPIVPGRYRLATIRFAVTSGAPRLDLVPASKYWLGPTSFGSGCGGLDYDNTQKLGSDWFDADGLDATTSSRPPVVDPIEDLTLDENTTASRHAVASDPDGDMLHLTVVGMPGYGSVSTPVQTPGRVEADLTFAPTYSASGRYSVSPLVSVVVSDGPNSRQSSFRVTARNVNRPPSILPIADATVEVGTTLRVQVYVSDPDVEERPVLALVDAPSFASFAAGIIDFHPGLTDVGTSTVRLSASDPFETVTSSFQVTVTNSGLHRAPEFDPIPEVWVEEGEFKFFTVRATAYEADAVSIRLLDGPRYVRVDPRSWPGFYEAQVELYPGPRDAGTATVRLEAFTSLYRTEVQFQIHVQDKPFPPQFAAWDGCIEPGLRGTSYFNVTAPDLDSVRVTCGDLPSWAQATASRVGYFDERFGMAIAGQLLVTAQPGPEELPSSFPITIYLNRGTPEETRWPATLVISPYDECMGYSGFLGSDDPPIPEAGGPYAGVAGAPVALHASSAPSAADANFRWTFGDGHASLGPGVSHVYAEGGTYRAIVRASNHPLSRDSADVVIAGAYPARAIFDHGPSGVQLSRKSDVWVTLKAEGDGYALSDLDLGSIELWILRGAVADSIVATGAGELETGGDQVRARLAHADLDRLFSGVRGRLTVEGRIQARLHHGARVRAPVTLTVVGRAGERGKIVVYPNPLNPSGTISFDVQRAGRVRARIYDVAGRLVRTLWDGPAVVGTLDLPFDGRTDRGDMLGSGVYFYRIESPDRNWRGRITVLK